MQAHDRSMSEADWVPPTIETGRIMNVNVNDWSVDVISEYANKRYFDLQVMSPYFHFANGEGIYCMPEIGAMVWICKPTQGRFGAPFVMGYQAPFDMANSNFQCGRQALNPGDIMMRTRDENFIILRRGGVVQIGSTPVAQRMYVPLRNFIKDFCENYEMHSFGGDLTWLCARTDQDSTGHKATTFQLSAKQYADEPLPVATLTIGSLGANDPAILELVINSTGDPKSSPKEVARMTMDNAGNVSWSIQKNWGVVAQGDIDFESQTGNISFKSDKGTANLQANKVVTVQSDTADVDITAASGTINEKSTGHIIDAPSIKLGGAGAAHKVPYGDVVQTILKTLISDLMGKGVLSAAPGSPVTYPGAAALLPLLDTMNSTVTKTM